MALSAPLKPSLFDKLIGELGEGNGARGMLPCYMPRLDRFGESELRACLMRDIGWLLNDIQLSTAVNLEDYPEVASSVINQGLPDLTGKSLDREGIARRARQIAAALRLYEPRLDPATIEVEIDGDKALADNRIRFKISGEIRTELEDSRFIVVTAIDLDTGNVEVGS